MSIRLKDGDDAPWPPGCPVRGCEEYIGFDEDDLHDHLHRRHDLIGKVITSEVVLDE